MLLTLYSAQGTYDARFLSNYAYINLADQITRLYGIGSVQIFRAPIRDAVVGEAGPVGKLAITVPEIVTAIQSQNTVNPAGRSAANRSPRTGIYVLCPAQGRLTSPEEFGQIGCSRVTRRSGSCA